MPSDDVTLDATFTVNADTLFKPLHGEGVLLDLSSGTYFGLDPTATRLWQLLQEHRSVRRAYEILLAEYDVSPGCLQNDLLAFVREVARRKLAAVTPTPLPR